MQEVHADFRPKQVIKFDEVIAISAKRRISTEKLKTRLRELLDVYADLEMMRDETGAKSLEIVHSQVTEQFGHKTLV